MKNKETLQEKLFRLIIEGGGMFGQSASQYKDGPEELKRQFLLEFQLQIRNHRAELLRTYGQEFVNELEKYD